MLLSYVAVNPVPFFNINSVSVVALVYVTVNEIYAVGTLDFHNYYIFKNCMEIMDMILNNFYFVHFRFNTVSNLHIFQISSKNAPPFKMT